MNPVSIIVIGLIFAVAFVVTMWRGASWTLALVFLPALLLLDMIGKVDLPGLPDTSPSGAVLYAVAIASLPRLGESMGIRWNLLDYLILLIPLGYLATGWSNGNWYTGAGAFGTQLLLLVGPYLLARIAFGTVEVREAALWATLLCVGVIVLFTLIEVRLWPYFYSRLLSPLGLSSEPTNLVMRRMSLFRPRVSFNHPIDFGNSMAVVLGLVYVLAATTRIGTRNLYVRIILVACIGCILASLSYTAYLALGTMLALYGLLKSNSSMRHTLPWIAAGGVVFGIMITLSLLAVKPEYPVGISDVRASFITRARIVQQSLPVAYRAGFFGFGEKLPQGELQLESVDNTYLLLAMRYGWTMVLIWIGIWLTVAVRTTRGLRHASSAHQRAPLAAATATVMGLMVAMYTVWFGFTYAVLWVVMLGFCNSLTDMYLAYDPARTQRRGFPVIAVRRPVPMHS